MSTGTTSGRNRLVVPAAAASILVIIIVGILLARSGDDETPVAPKATKTTTEPAATPSRDTLTGSGDAPDAIAVKDATVGRSATIFGLAADLPDLDIEKFDTIDLVLGQDNGDVLWRLTTFRDSRGAFITPQLYLQKDGPDEQFACNGATVRVKATQLTASVPLACLDKSEKPLRARLEITDRDGGEEKTSTSKTLRAPKS
jgi:hypothetical protein